MFYLMLQAHSLEQCITHFIKSLICTVIILKPLLILLNVDMRSFVAILHYSIRYSYF